MDTRSSFSSICMLWISVCVGLHSGELVSGYLGSTAVLPCKLKSVGPETHIRWSTESEIVFERKGVNSYQADGYKDRVDVPEEELRKGNLSLVLRNLQLTDKNVYNCSYKVRVYKRDTRVIPEFREISSVSLSVSEKPPEKKSDEVSSPTGDAGITRPHPLISITALISCFLVLLF
ncbi:hypothetical protein C0J50_8738 [Silurus asotus]|uniref:Ig-like domain-containing protein n=1 Tax=Silurus asotus TaxID=30991 RepID=A0AAD5AFQ4_SILAS|nr:hypothetical protein C0J50_8738 [Silurus asotus]